MEDSNNLSNHYPKVHIIILNWNGWDDTIECLESLYKINYPNYQVIVVDNASSNESIKKIKDYSQGLIPIESPFVDYDKFNKPIEVIEILREEAVQPIDHINKGKANEFVKKLVLIKNEQNYGFPEGCNIGMKYALKQGSDFILLLNNDTVVDNNFLMELIKVAREFPNDGIFGSKVYFYKNPHKIQAAGGTINWWTGTIRVFSGYDKGQYEKIRSCDFVFGTSFLIRSEVINKISFMDSTFFFGVEEYDYCTRAKRAGFNILYVPKSVIWHKGGASSSKLANYPDTLNFIKKSGGHKYRKYYYKLFKKYSPKSIYFFSYSLYILKDNLFFSLLRLVRLKDWRTIKEGFYTRLGII